jgi:hypothetical protein
MATFPASTPSDLPWLVALAVLLVLLLVVLFCRGLSRLYQVGIAVATLCVMWLLAKESFVRLDSGHWVEFFAPLPLIAAFTMTPRAKRAWAGAVLLGSVLLGAIALCYAAGGAIPEVAYRPDIALQQIRGEFDVLSSSSQQEEVALNARTAMRKTYAIPQAMIAKMRSGTVDVSPWEQNVAWAWNLRSDALPIPQNYSAYGSTLVDLDAEDLQSRRAPEFILAQPEGVSVDSRLGSFDPPTTQFDIECLYRQVAISAYWQLLQRGRDICGKLQSVEVVHTHAGHPIAAPRVGKTDELVATFSPNLPLSWHLENVLLKPPLLCLSARIAGVPKSQTFRFIEGTAGDIHIIKPALTINYSPNFSAPALEDLSLRECTNPRVDFELSVHFYRVRITNTIPYFLGLGP